MARLDIGRQKALEPTRMEYAKKEIEKRGYSVREIGDNELQFIHTMGNVVYFFPYSGWHSGSSIKDGRGLNKLLAQI